MTSVKRSDLTWRDTNHMTRKTVAEIDLAALRFNVQQLQRMAPNSQSIAVVKANAYGNGAIKVAKTLESLISMFAVAIAAEAHELRTAGIQAPILILQGPLSEDELEHTVESNLHWMLHSEYQLHWFQRANEFNSLDGHQWIKFDTGMHRLGFLPEDFQRLSAEFSDIFTQQAVFATHLARADEQDPIPAEQQILRFHKLISPLKNRLSIANSAGIVAFESARCSFNRIGIAAYGCSPFDDTDRLTLKPVMTLKAPIIALRSIPAGDQVGYGGTWTATRRSRIATVAIGYADGYPRHAPIGTPAMVRGQRAYLVGRVSMDMLTFDVTDIDNCDCGDMVELWGNQLAVTEVASHVGTIGYELITRISNRVPRQYVN